MEQKNGRSFSEMMGPSIVDILGSILYLQTDKDTVTLVCILLCRLFILARSRGCRFSASMRCSFEHPKYMLPNDEQNILALNVCIANG